MRPYWSGQLQISLVSFGVSLFTATDSKSEIRFHQISRRTGERVRHQKVSADEGPVENSDIVKGYEYAKGQYVTIEPEEIENLRLPTRKAIEVSQFVDAKEITPNSSRSPTLSPLPMTCRPRPSPSCARLCRKPAKPRSAKSPSAAANTLSPSRPIPTTACPA